MHARILLFLPPLLIAGCDDLPRDVARTSERIEASGAMRVAILPGTPDPDPAVTLLQRYARAHGARLELVQLHGEHAQRALQQGEIGVLIGHFAKASPWQADIALSKPVARGEPDDSEHPVLRIARRNGENALILATDRAIAEARR